MLFHRSDSHLPQVEMNAREVAERFRQSRWFDLWGDWNLRRCITTFVCVDEPDGLGLSFDPGEMGNLFWNAVEDEVLNLMNKEAQSNE